MRFDAQLRSMLVLGVMLCARASLASDMLPDSTIVDRWRLDNGLRVVSRHTPGAQGVAIVVAYRAGDVIESREGKGRAALLAELAFRAPAGDLPDRTREELASLRPLGWSIKTNPRLAVLSEIVPTGQFPFVLHEVATRMRGVRVTPASFAAIGEDVRRDLADAWLVNPSRALWSRTRLLALGTPDEAIVRAATSKSLLAGGPKAAQQALATYYVPSNAVLSLAGDLSSVGDLRALVEREFGSIPAGAPPRIEEPQAPKSATRAIAWSGLSGARGAVAIVAPDVRDSLHAAFWLAQVIAGAHAREAWAGRLPPGESAFTYSLFDEPDLVRFYPPVAEKETTPQALSSELVHQLDVLAGMTVTRDVLTRVGHSIGWLVGGPLPDDVRRRLTQDAGALNTLAANAATQEIWLGPEFWAAYRRRVDAIQISPGYWLSWYSDPAHRVELLLTPRP